MVESHSISTRRACRCCKPTEAHSFTRAVRTTQRPSVSDYAICPRFGYRRLHVLLKREGWIVNHKKLHRLYQEEGLAIRTKRRKKRAAQIRLALPEPKQVNELWSMDFVSDAPTSRHKFRALTVIDCFSREALAIELGHTFTSEDVTRTLDRIIARKRRSPRAIKVDNGTEFTSNHFDAWAYKRGIQIDYIETGRPVQNAFIESFNGRLREECLNANWFQSLDEARQVIEDWRRHYNEVRPHSSLGYLAPAAYVESLLAG